MLKGKNIVIGITGGIAAYKIPSLVRSLKKAGARVRVVMTDAAKEFVTPLTLSTLSGEEVIVNMFPASDADRVDASTWHITLGQWADVMLVAPATANVVTKLAHGFADNAVTTLALAMRCPIIVSPAM
ncbi:MAG TPA: flavoprotein, partial [Bacteroidota bacterium]|nr:flavoprotein [Bacteroidota bacterium]